MNIMNVMPLIGLFIGGIGLGIMIGFFLLRPSKTVFRSNYDKEHKILFIKWSKEEYAVSEEHKKGVILDYGKRGNVIGIEVFFNEYLRDSQ